jgi:hypothetical protein
MSRCKREEDFGRTHPPRRVESVERAESERLSLPRGEECVVALVEGPGDTHVSPKDKPCQMLRELSDGR